jgi:hypothetical protein
MYISANVRQGEVDQVCHLQENHACFESSTMVARALAGRRLYVRRVLIDMSGVQVLQSCVFDTFWILLCQFRCGAVLHAVMQVPPGLAFAGLLGCRTWWQQSLPFCACSRHLR